MLAEAGADLEVQLEDGSTPLWNAAALGFEGTVDALLKAGADIRAEAACAKEARAEIGETRCGVEPIAEIRGHAAVVKVLKKHEARQAVSVEASPPRVTNIQLQESRKDVHVTYDLACGAPARVDLVGSLDGGKTFVMKIVAVSGDVGSAVSGGTGKRVVWRMHEDYPAGLDDKDVVLEVRAVSAAAR
jgi:hypothetical protein